MTAEAESLVHATGTARSAAPLIAHVIHRFHTGGMENGLVNLINRLPRDRYRHAVVCLTESTAFAERLDRDDVQIYPLHKRPGKDPAVYWRFWRLVRALRPSIVHTRNIGALDLAPVAALAGIPVRIHGEHGWDAADATGANPRYRRLRRWCDVAVTRYVAVSRDIQAWLGGGIGVAEGKVRHVCNGVDVDRFRPDGPGADLFPDEPVPEKLTIGSVGRMDPIKGFDVLVDAVAVLVSDEPAMKNRIRVAIVGDGAERAAIAARIADRGLDDVIFLAGNRSDVPEVLRALDVFVLASINEGISNTILEAMATGLPIVATNVGGNPELIDDRKTGSLVPPGDVQALAAAIRTYLENEDLRRQHGHAARQRAESTFSLDSMIAGYRRLYDEFLYRNETQGKT